MFEGGGGVGMETLHIAIIMGMLFLNVFWTIWNK